MQGKGNPPSLLMEMSIGTASMENWKADSSKTINIFAIWSSSLAPGHVSRQNYYLKRKDTCTLMFTAALFTIAKTWKQPRCLLTHEWIWQNKWYVYALEYYSAIKKNEIMPFATTWMDLRIILLNEVSKKGKYHMVSLICRILKKNDTNELFYKTEIDSRLKRMNLWLQEVGWRG